MFVRGKHFSSSVLKEEWVFQHCKLILHVVWQHSQCLIEKKPSFRSTISHFSPVNVPPVH